jgi:hypothetical protein
MLRIGSFSKVAMLSLIPLVCLPNFLNGCSQRVIESSAKDQPEPDAVGYYLPKGLIHLVINPKAGTQNPPDYEITFSVISVPDTEYLYTLTYLPKPTADDNINIQLGPNGLLKTITTTTIDKMPEIIQKIAALVPTVLKQSIPAAQASKLQLVKTIKNIDVIFDPDNQDDLKTLGNLKDAVGLVVDVKPLSKDQKTYVQSVDSTSPHSVYYRLFVPYQVTVQFDSVTKEANPPSSTGVGYYNVSQILYVPNHHSPILSCDIKRTAFVTKTTTLTFTDGVLTGSAITKPSEVLGFMSIPLNVATAIVAVPASIVKFRIDTTTQEKALVDAQKDLIKSQAARIQELQALQKAKESGGN